MIFSLFQYFALMFLLLLMELGVAIYLYIEKDKVKNRLKHFPLHYIKLDIDQNLSIGQNN